LAASPRPKTRPPHLRDEGGRARARVPEPGTRKGKGQWQWQCPGHPTPLLARGAWRHMEHGTLPIPALGTSTTTHYHYEKNQALDNPHPQSPASSRQPAKQMPGAREQGARKANAGRRQADQPETSGCGMWGDALRTAGSHATHGLITAGGEHTKARTENAAGERTAGG
jgi:hypothetical protein